MINYYAFYLKNTSEFYDWKSSYSISTILVVTIDMYDDNELFCEGLSLKDVRFVVISQPNSYHKKRAAEFKKHFEDQIIHLPEVWICNLLINFKDLK